MGCEPDETEPGIKENQKGRRKEGQNPVQNHACAACSLTRSAIYELRTSGPLNTILKPIERPRSRYASNCSGDTYSATLRLLARGLEVVADGSDVDILLSQIAQELVHFLRSCPPQTGHEAGFREDFRAMFPRKAQHIHRLLIFRLRANAPVEPRHRFHVCG